MKQNTVWQIEKIIDVSNTLASTGKSGASTSELIAAAFVLNCMEYLPDGYEDAVDAWDRLEEEWQGYVRQIKRDYRHRLLQG